MHCRIIITDLTVDSYLKIVIKIYIFAYLGHLFSQEQLSTNETKVFINIAYFRATSTYYDFKQ